MALVVWDRFNKSLPLTLLSSSALFTQKHVTSKTINDKYVEGTILYINHEVPHRKFLT